MQFDGFNPFSSLNDEMALMQQYLPLHPFQKLLADSQKGFQRNDEDDENGRIFFTVTMTETKDRGHTRTVYCTTSTAAISTCSPSGRRKRFSKGVRGLFYNEEVQKINFEEEQMQIEDETNLLLHSFNNERLILLHLIKLNILKQLQIMCLTLYRHTSVEANRGSETDTE